MHQEPGEGIGLSIVKRLCELLDATIEMESDPGEGTTLRIVFPRRYQGQTLSAFHDVCGARSQAPGALVPDGSRFGMPAVGIEPTTNGLQTRCSTN